MQEQLQDVRYVAGFSDSIGFFTWVLADNRLYADPVFAVLYDIPIQDLLEGVPVEVILEKVADEDRAMIARNTHEAIILGNTSASAYSIKLSEGRKRRLVAYGRCFRSANGDPSIFTGAVMDAMLPDVTFGSDALESHCRAAYEIAAGSGQELAARYLRAALSLLSSRPEP